MQNKNVMVNAVMIASASLVIAQMLPVYFLADLQPGFFNYTYNKDAVKLLVAALFFILLQPRVVEFLRNIVKKASKQTTLGKYETAFYLSIISLGLFLLLYTKNPIQHTGVFESMIAQGKLFVFSNPLSTWVNYQLYSLIAHHNLTNLLTSLYQGGDVSNSVITLQSNLSGFFFVIFLTLFASEIFEDRKKSIVFFLIVFLQGYLFLFFGDHGDHSQQYPAIALFLWLSVRYLKGKAGIFFPSAALGIAFLMHMVSGLLFPSLFILYYVKERKKNENPESTNFINSLFTKEALLLYLGIIVTVGLFFRFVYSDQYDYGNDLFGGGDMRMFVPIDKVGSAYEHYTMFTYDHLKDVINAMIFLAPIGLALSGIMACMERKKMLEDNTAVFLLAGSIPTFLFLLAWNPDFGVIADFPLFSIGAFMPTLLGAYLFCKKLGEKNAFTAAVAAVSASLIHLIPIIMILAGKW